MTVTSTTTASALTSGPLAPRSSGSVCGSSSWSASAQTALATKKPIQTATSRPTLRQMRSGRRRPKSLAAGRPPSAAKKYAAPISAAFWMIVSPMFTPGGGSLVDAPNAPEIVMTTIPNTIVAP